MRRLHRLLATELQVQEQQLSTLEHMLLLAGERSSSLPDPHHILEGEAYERLLEQLLAQQRQHENIVPLLEPEIQACEERLRAGPGGPSSSSAPTYVRQLWNELCEFDSLQVEAMKALEDSASERRSGGGGGQAALVTATASQLFDVLNAKLELLTQVQDSLVDLQARAASTVPASATLANRGSSSSRPSDGTKTKHERVVIGLAEEALQRLTGGNDKTGGLLESSVALLRNAPSSEERGPSPSPAGVVSAALNLLRPKEGSVASSDASWKNEFHGAVLRTMLRTESPRQAVSEVLRSVTSLPGSSGAGLTAAVRREDVDRVCSESPPPSNPRSHSGSRRSTPENVPRSAIDAPQRGQLVQLLEERVDAMDSSVMELHAAAAEVLNEANQMLRDSDDALLQLRAENDDLRREVEHLGKTVERLRRGRDHYDDAAEKHVRQSHESLKSAQQACVDLRAKVEALERQAVQRERERHLLTSSMEELRRANEAKDATIQQLAERERDARRSADGARREREVELREALRRSEESEKTTAALRLRVQSLEEEASRTSAQLEATQSELASTKSKYDTKSTELRDAALLYTKLEKDHRAVREEASTLRDYANEKSRQLATHLTVQHLKSVCGVNGGQVAPVETVGGGERATPTVGTPRGGRLMRLSFDASPPLPRAGEAATKGPALPRSEPTIPAAPIPHSGPVPLSTAHETRLSSSSSNANVYKVLSDAAQLLDTIQRARQPAEPRSADLSTSGTPQTESAMTTNRQHAATAGLEASPQNHERYGSEDGRGERTKKQQNVRKLQEELQSLLTQEATVLQKRSVVAETLLAQRNQLLMRHAPDADVEALNNQIATVMSQVDDALSRIQHNKRSVEKKIGALLLDLAAPVKQGLSSVAA